MLILDKANVNLMYCTSEGGKQGYLPKNVAFLPSPDETEILDHNRTLIGEAASLGLEEVKNLPIRENGEIYTEVADLENHLYLCVPRDLENGELDSIDELISLFKRFNQ